MNEVTQQDSQQGENTEMESTLRMAVEALIFAAEESLSARLLAESYAEATGNPKPDDKEVEEIIVSLNDELRETGRPFTIEKWGGGYRFATRSEMAPFIKALLVTDRQRKLSRTLMESVAILAYRQPTSRSELEFVRGVDCDYAIRKLIEYGLINVVGRSETIGRPLLYGTTDRFLELFGLGSLTDLPNLRELESILDDPAFQKEKARLLMTTAVQLPLNIEKTSESDSSESGTEEIKDVQEER